MKRTTKFFVVSLSLALVFFLVSGAGAQVDVGNFTISGSAEVNGLPRHKSGADTKFEEYRDIPETIIVPQLKLMIGSKKNDFYLEFDSTKVGLDDQNYRVRFGRYGLLDVEFEWDQIPHTFNADNARSPYARSGGTYTLPVRATAADIADGTTTTANLFNVWINGNARRVDLDLLQKIGKITIRYTPRPRWSFTGKYWSQKTDGERPIAFPFGSGSSSNVAELAEPIDYQTHNIELGGEYAGDGWSLGLRYDGSIFHNDVSTLVFDNPAAAGPVCVDAAAINYAAGAGPCRGRVDLYPSNQAHTFTLTGTARLPLKSQFLGSASYGWRIQDDSFLPFTINSMIANPVLSRSNLDGDVRPTMINLRLVNNFVKRLNVKVYYRFYDLDNRTPRITTTGTVRNDQSSGGPDWTRSHRYQYSKNNAGVDAAYRLARWLTAKLAYGYERIHRTDLGEFHNSTEHSVGPTFDATPFSWLLLRAAYKRSWRDAPGYSTSNRREMYYLTNRVRNKGSLFADVTPWETVSFHGGFDFTLDTFPAVQYGFQHMRTYSPSVGVLYAPLEWLRLFADYNFDWNAWRTDIGSSTSATTYASRGKDLVHTISLGSDVEIIKNLLGFRIQYGFSHGTSRINGFNSTGTLDHPSNKNSWHELLARLEYQVHKNIALKLGYYFNRYSSNDFGVDIMNVWMGNLDTNSGQLRSIYLGDRFKGSYTAHVGLVGVKFSF